jgi:neutral trehalase
MDNSPRFDNITSMTAVDLSSYMTSEYYSLEKLARCVDKDADAAEWRERRRRIADLMNELLWDDEDRFYYDLDEYHEFIPIKTTAGFMPLLGQAPDRDRAEALRMHLMNPNEFWSPFPVPSVSQDEASYTNDLWRGATWPNVNVLIYYGLMGYGFFQEARDLALVTVREITRLYMRHGCFYECYDSSSALSPPDMPRKGAPGEKGGVGFGVVADLHWTAAAYVHLTHELY